MLDSRKAMLPALTGLLLVAFLGAGTAEAQSSGTQASQAGISDANRSRVREIFEELDMNKDNVVTRAERRAKYVLVFNAIDKNYDGIIAYDETRLTPQSFQAADKNGDGGLSGLELFDARFNNFDALDLDGNGVLTLIELENFAAQVMR